MEQDRLIGRAFKNTDLDISEDKFEAMLQNIELKAKKLEKNPIRKFTNALTRFRERLSFKDIMEVAVFVLILVLVPVGITAYRMNGNGRMNSAYNHLKWVKLEDFMKTAQIPANLKIYFDADAVVEKQTAKSYKIDFMQLDTEKVAEKILRYPIRLREPWGMGTRFETGDGVNEEYLHMYEEPKCVGLAYSLFNEKTTANRSIFDLVANPQDMLGYHRKAKYNTKQDLSFLGYEEAVAETQKLLKSIGFPAFALQEVHTLDVSSMEKEQQRYIEWRSTLALEDETYDIYEFSKEDEAYLIHFRQVYDGLPFINTAWADRYSGDLNGPVISVYYSKDGIISIWARDIYKIKKTANKGALINSAAAMQVFLDHFRNTPHDSETILFSMELNYVPVYGKAGFDAVPAWVFGTHVTEKFVTEDGEHIRKKDKYFVVDAFSGKQIKHVLDDRENR
jgi:hypothetical protein